LTRRPSLGYCPTLQNKPVGQAFLPVIEREERELSLANTPQSVLAHASTDKNVCPTKAAVMGTKPMVFPLDANGRVYVLHNEADEPVCTGSRETCYRLLELMLEVKKRADETELKMTETTAEIAKAASATAGMRAEG
jgi:hypothetical protein